MKEAHGSNPPGRWGRSRTARARGRLLVVVLVILTLSLAAYGAILIAASVYQARRDLGNSLVRTALALRDTRSRNLEQLTHQADLVALDPRLQQYREALRLAGPRSPEGEELQQALHRHLEDTFQTTGGDVLVLVGPDGRVELRVDRAGPEAEGQPPVEPSEATSPAEAGPGVEGKAPERLHEGQPLQSPLVDAVFGDGDSRAGTVRLEAEGPLYTVAAVPLRKGARWDGVLLLGERVTEETLAQWGQGFSDGVVLAVAGGEILAAHDRRAARRPSPAVLSSLEEAISHWQPPAEPEEALGAGEEPTPPGRLEIGGREWMALPVALGVSTGQRPAGWILFLGDTSTLDDEVRREVWLLVEVGGALVALGLAFAWLAAGWVTGPPDKPEAPPAG